MEKISCVLLIDDQDADNFLHTRAIKKSEVVNYVHAVNSAEKAGEYLSSAYLEVKEPPYPDLIFLDINMPRINGWEFLSTYKATEHCQEKHPTIYMLTTSKNPEDQEKAKSLDIVSGFITKPLTKEIMQDIFQRHYKRTNP